GRGRAAVRHGLPDLDLCIGHTWGVRQGESRHQQGAGHHHGLYESLAIQHGSSGLVLGRGRQAPRFIDRRDPGGVLRDLNEAWVHSPLISSPISSNRLPLNFLSCIPVIGRKLVALVLILRPVMPSGTGTFLRLAACFMMFLRDRSLPQFLSTVTSVLATA